MFNGASVHDTHAIMSAASRMAVYLDCAATTPIDPRVRDEVLLYLEEEFGNAGSRTHEYGRRARKAVERARDRVAAVVQASRGDVFFTSGATESNNLAILGLGREPEPSGTSSRRASSITPCWNRSRELQRRGFDVTYLEPGTGRLDRAGSVREALRPDTLLVSIMHANNETGVLQPVAEIADAIGDHPAFFHVDAAQGFGKEIDATAAPAHRHDQRQRAQDSCAEGSRRADSAAAERSASAGAAAAVRRRAGARAASGNAAGPPDCGIRQGGGTRARRMAAARPLLPRIPRAAAGRARAAASGDQRRSGAVASEYRQPLDSGRGCRNRHRSLERLCRDLRWRGLHVGVVHVQPRPFGDAASRRANGRRAAVLLVPHSDAAGFGGMIEAIRAMKPETVAYKRSRFSTRLPVTYRYTPSHYWLRESEPGVWQVGFTKFATRMLGEMVEFDFKVEPGARIEVGQVIGWTEGFKAMSDIYSAASGEFLGPNPALAAEHHAHRSRALRRRLALPGSRQLPIRRNTDVNGYIAVLDATIDTMLRSRHDEGETQDG